MSKNRSVATEKPDRRFANGACELLIFIKNYMNTNRLMVKYITYKVVGREGSDRQRESVII